MIALKAWLAPILISSAWKEQQQTATLVKPWPWADFHPVARLQLDRLSIDQWVLDDPSARSLAFGPVMVKSAGSTNLYGHRDTHFSFLQDVHIGDEISLQSIEGQVARYQVVDQKVAKSGDVVLPSDPEEKLLVLITCYPFDAILPGGPQRYIIFAKDITSLG